MDRALRRAGFTPPNPEGRDKPAPTAGSVGALPDLIPSTREYVESRSIAEEYDDFNSRNELFEFDTRFLDRFIRRRGRLIDVGCGTGRHLVHFARRGLDVTGVDLSELMLSIASRKLSASGLKAAFVHRDMRDLSDLASDRYDYAICMFSTLGMVPGRAARQAVLEQMFRILVPGGRIFVHAHNRLHKWYTPDRFIWLTLNSIASAIGREEFGDLRMDTYRGIQDMYLHIYSAREMRNVLAKAGFQDVYMTHLNERRNGELSGEWFRDLRANGFIATAVKKKV